MKNMILQRNPNQFLDIASLNLDWAAIGQKAIARQKSKLGSLDVKVENGEAAWISADS